MTTLDTEPEGQHDMLIAIIGMAGRLPGASDLDEFWLNLRKGAESIRFLSDEECLAAGIPAETLATPGYVRAVSSMSDIENFDAAMFGYTPREAALSDPQIRAFLEVVHSALENAGYDPLGFKESVGVYGSSGVNRYADLHLAYAGDASSASSMAVGSLNNMDYLTTTASYRLNLHGPSMFVATACSSSLVAVHLACQALRNGECDVAVAGGVDIEFPVGHGYQWDEGGPVSSDGHVRPFDAGATGTVFGSGCAAVVLKRYSDAVADRDTISAIIRGSAVNNDGSDKPGMTAPSITGQAKMIAEAIAVAGVEPPDIGYVEAHATGTPLGDPIEVAALTRAFRHAGVALPLRTCALGSVKGNVGHLGHAAGVTSLLKAALALAHEEIPATINFRTANPKLALDESPFYVNDRLLPWPRTAAAPRIAGVSSFGVGGTNCHVILEEAPSRGSEQVDGRPQILVWSAKSDTAATAYQEKLASFLTEPGLPALTDIAGTLQEGRAAHPARRAAVGLRADDLAGSLRADAVTSGPALHRRIVFCFPGQGAQQVRMAAGLYQHEPAFTEALDQAFELFAEAGMELREPWLSGTPEELANTLLAQPLLFAVESALARMFASWGIQPDAVMGHSLGELVAGYIAGVFGLPDAIRLVAARAKAMADAPAGGMLAVAAPADECANLLPGHVCVAATNGPRQTIVAGPPGPLGKAAAALREHGLAVRPLATGGAFHSELMTEAAGKFEHAFAGESLAEPQLRFYSAAAGRVMTNDAATPAFWARQLCEPVRFDRALAAVAADGPALLMELGPGRVISALTSQCQELLGDACVAVPTLPAVTGGADDDLVAALQALTHVWVDGHDVRWDAVRCGPVSRVPLPGYQFQRRRHWVERRAQPKSAVPHQQTAAPGEDNVAPFAALTWVEEPRQTAAADQEPVNALVLLPSDPAAGSQLVPAMHEAGLRVTIARPGNSYAAAGDEFRLRPGARSDIADVLRTLSARGLSPRLLVHALGIHPHVEVTGEVLGEQLEEDFYSLVALVQEGGRWPVGGHQPGLLVLTSHSADITGAEPVDPVRAALHGFMRSLAVEAPPPGCRLIDIGPAPVAAELAAEIQLWPIHEIVALRGARRWTRREVPARAPQSASLVRRRGVYLLTGGPGGLGRAVARGLAQTGLCPRLVLLSRSGLPGGADGADAELLRREITNLEALGCEVRVMAGDVTDRRAVRRALDVAAAQYGRLDGVIHLAGVPGDGMVCFRDRAALAAVLAPKVQGTVILAELLADRPALDFLVFFSSRAAIDGLAGSADYAAANAFQDAFAQVLRRRQVPAVSINWPSWSGTGMAVDHASAQRGDASAQALTWRAELGVEGYPLLDEHRIGDAPVLPGTAHLDLVVRAFREVVPGCTEVPVLLEEAVFERILVARTPRRVEVRFEREEQRWQFSVWSVPASSAGSLPVRHASGHISALPAWAPARVDVAALEQAFTVAIDDDDDAAARQVFTLGPRWQNLIRMRTRPGNQETELLAELELSEQYRGEEADHMLHPALLDSATSEVRRRYDDPHLPFLYQSLTVRDRLPYRFTSHIKRRGSASGGLITADIELIGTDGTVLAEIRGFTMRRVDDPLSLATSEDAKQEAALADETADNGIPPDEGARLLLALLREGSQNQVVVRPYVRGEPLALGENAPTPAARALPQPSTAYASPAVSAGPERQADESPTPTQNAEGPPGGAIEDRLRQLWVQAIGQSEIGLDSDFFDLGGNSLTAVELMSGIRTAFEVNMSIAALFDHPNIASLANFLREQGAR